MKRIALISMFLFSLLNFANSQTDSEKEICRKNFEEYFRKFKAAYPADQFEYIFSNYSDLIEMRPYPDDMVYLSSMDSMNCDDKFYSLYAHKISRLTKEDTRVEELPVSTKVKKVYKKLKRLILSSELSSEHNVKKEITIAKKMRELMEKESPPLTGYGQTVMSHSENSEGVIHEGKMFITYDLELNVLGMGVIN